MNEVRDYYNKGQDECEILEFYIDRCKRWEVELLYKKKHKKFSPPIGFYQWLIAPEYKTLRIFKVPVAMLLSDKKLYVFKQPDEILKILLESREG